MFHNFVRKGIIDKQTPAERNGIKVNENRWETMLLNSIKQEKATSLTAEQEEIDATEVIIRTREGKDLIVRNPQVAKVNMMGQETLQVSGTIEEVPAFSSEDVKTMMDQASVDEATARKILEKHNGDLAEALMELQKT